MKHDSWGDKVALTGSMYSNFETGYPGAGGGLDCVAAKFDNPNHEWAIAKCSDDAIDGHYALCQKMVREYLYETKI